MNSTELYIAAGDAIRGWAKTNDSICYLYLKGEQVVCRKICPCNVKYDPALIISKCEVRWGMSSSRWNAIGKALYKLFVKEQKCQESQKH